MYDQFDKQLAERIKHVFDTYEDGSADEGWEKLRKSFPEKKNRKALLYWASSAAAILVICAGLWFFERPALNEQIAKTESSATTGTEDNTLPSPKTRDLKEELSTSERTGPQLAEAKKEVLEHERLSTSTAALLAADAPERSENTLSISSAIPIALNPADSAHSATSAAVYAAVTTPTQPVADKKESTPLEVMTTAEKLASIKELTVAKRTDRKQGKLSVGIFAGSFINYSEGSKAGMNPGVGLLSELAISKKLKISTGLTLAQNTLKFDHVPTPQSSVRMMDAPSRNPTEDKESMTNSFMARTSSDNYSMDGYNASLLGLDIPVNLKYMLVENKRDLYVLAGLSSNFFIDESYTYKYSDISYTLDGETRNAKESTTKNSSFDFARMLNFSVGFGYPVGKQSKLSVEPFVKYPLGGLGSQDIRFGSAGLNLKFNFSNRH